MLRAPRANRALGLVLRLDKQERRAPGVERERQLVGELPILRADRALIDALKERDASAAARDTALEHLKELVLNPDDWK